MIEAAIVSTFLATLSPATPADLRDRYASDIAAAADTVEEAAALSVTQLAESDLDPRVETCKRTGDNDQSVTAFQMKRHWWAGRSRAELCASNALAAIVAMAGLRELRRRTGSWHYAFRRWVGVQTETDPHLRGRGHNFDRLMANWRRAQRENS